MFNKKQELDRNKDFVVKESYAMFMIMLLLSIGFTAFFAYFVNPSEAGLVYWFILGMLLLVVFVFAYKAITIRPTLIINKKGIYFAHKKLFIKWSQVSSAGFFNIKPEGESEDFRLMVYYYPHKENKIALASFKVTSFMDKSESELENAVAFYHKGQ